MAYLQGLWQQMSILLATCGTPVLVCSSLLSALIVRFCSSSRHLLRTEPHWSERICRCCYWNVWHPSWRHEYPRWFLYRVHCAQLCLCLVNHAAQLGSSSTLIVFFGPSSLAHLPQVPIILSNTTCGNVTFTLPPQSPYLQSGGSIPLGTDIAIGDH
jgi:hypothetical protein